MQDLWFVPPRGGDLQVENHRSRRHILQLICINEINALGLSGPSPVQTLMATPDFPPKHKFLTLRVYPLLIPQSLLRLPHQWYHNNRPRQVVFRMHLAFPPGVFLLLKVQLHSWAYRGRS